MLAGYAAAAEVGAKVIVKMDSDDQIDTDYLLPLIMPIIRREADYTKGNRFLHRASVANNARDSSHWQLRLVFPDEARIRLLECL